MDYDEYNNQSIIQIIIILATCKYPTTKRMALPVSNGKSSANDARP